VNDDSLKLTIYYGERDRTGGGFLADALVEIFARHELQTSLVMRGVAGFGAKQRMRTDRLLTLSEDLPLVSVAVDTRERIHAGLADVEALRFDGLVTLERARLLTSRLSTVDLPEDLHEATKLTIYVGRQQRAGSRPAYEAVVDVLHRHGVAGATVLLGVDGTAHGARQRARFFAANADVPLMVISVGHGQHIAEALSELDAMLDRPIATLERIRICKRDGQRIALPHHLPETDASGLQMWQKLMVYASEQSRYDGGPLYRELLRCLREAGAAGATSLRGIWGYHGDHTPHGDTFWQLRRRVPVLTVIVDTPANIHRWFTIVDELTQQTGLVTSEIVPAYRARAGDTHHGGLRLAHRWND
jgi:PII-like signaling protein